MLTEYQRDVRVLVVDDHAYFRSVMGELIAATPGFALVGDVTCGEEALAVTLELSPDLVLMDIRMPGAGGLATARLMAKRHPQVVILLVSAFDREDVAEEISEMAVSFAPKRELCASVLREVWERATEARKRVSPALSG
jgi:DNA-binding NarL/FixJ family response regulator